MKKVTKTALILTIVLMFGYLFTACKGTQECSSYGEVKKYQRESRR